MEKTKVTKRDLFGALRGLVEGAEVENKEGLLEFIDNEVARLAKRASQPTKTQKENEPLKEAIVAVLAEAGAPLMIKDIQAADEALAGLSGQKVSALLTSLKKEGKVVRTEDKKKAYFSVAE